MPIYEYACEACGHKLEVLQKMSEAPLTDCPECGKPELRKLVSAAGFQLKGSGWYVTDFKGGKAANNGSKENGSGTGDKTSGAGEAAKGGNGKDAGTATGD